MARHAHLSSAQPKHLARIVERLDYFPTRDASAARTTDEHDVPFLLFGNKSIHYFSLERHAELAEASRVQQVNYCVCNEAVEMLRQAQQDVLLHLRLL